VWRGRQFPERSYSADEYFLYAGLGLFFSALVTAPILWFLYLFFRQRQRGEFEDRRTLGLAADELRQAESEVSEGATDFLSLWRATQKRLDYYHTIATTQSRDSFLYGQLAAGAGFLVIVIACIAAVFSDSSAAAIAAALIGVTGGGLGGYIGATFMRVQAATSESMQGYFLQPLEFSRLLAMERLIETLPAEDRARAVQQLIGTIGVQGPVDAA
jgi:hypothetical protein